MTRSFFSRCQQLVLVGDHHQLPPTVISEQAEAEGLTLSLFERLVHAGTTTLAYITPSMAIYSRKG